MPRSMNLYTLISLYFSVLSKHHRRKPCSTRQCLHGNTKIEVAGSREVLAMVRQLGHHGIRSWSNLRYSMKSGRGGLELREDGHCRVLEGMTAFWDA